MSFEEFSPNSETDPRAIDIAVFHFPEAVCYAEKRGIHTFVIVEHTANPLDSGLYIYDDIKYRLIHVIPRSDGASAALGRSIEKNTKL